MTPKRGSYDLMEVMRQKVSWSQQIVENKDPEYAYYSGGSLEIAERMATLDTFLKLGLFDERIIPLIKLCRAFLDQHRKAFFASVGSTEYTKLGFILGITDDATISAVET